MGSGHDFVVLRAHVSVLNPINVCHFNANFAFLLHEHRGCYFSQHDFFFDVHVKMGFVLTLTVILNHWRLSDL